MTFSFTFYQTRQTVSIQQKSAPLAVLGGFPHGLTGRLGSIPPREHKKRAPVKGVRFSVVEVAGFEPAAFWSRTKRATKLRYTSTLEPMRGLEPLTC